MQVRTWKAMLGTAAILIAVSGCTSKSKVEPQDKKSGAELPTTDDGTAAPEPTLRDNRGADFDPSPDQTTGDTNQSGDDGDSKIRIVTDNRNDNRNTNNGDVGGDDSGTTRTTITYRPFSGELSQEQINGWVENHRSKLSESGKNAEEYRYAYIPQVFIDDKEEINYARVGLSKAINTVAIAAEEIVNPEDVSDGHGVVYALHLPSYWGDQWQQKWGVVAGAREKRVFSPAPRLDLRAFDGNAPVSADRLAYNMLHGGVYNQLVDMPSRGRNLIRSLGADQVNIRMGVQAAITYGPRYVQRRQLRDWDGAYWESFDDFNGRRRELIWKNGSIPRFRGDGMVADYGTVASEAWYHMKNGLPAYIIWGNANQERSKAEFSFVRDPLNHKGGALVNGFCVFCHISGVQAAANDMYTAIEAGEVPGDQARLKEFWTDNKTVAAQFAEDRAIVLKAIDRIVYGMSDGDDTFNKRLATGANPREPIFFLISDLTGSRLNGDTTGLSRRDPVTGQIPGLQRNNNGRRGVR